LFHLSEAWILFIPITYLLPVLYLFFLLVVFLWWLLFKPLFFAYSLVYDRKVSEFRPYGDIKEIILTQALLFQQVWHFKVYLLREFGSFLLYHTRMIFIAARSPDDSVYWKSWEELTEPMREIFFQEQKELNDWFERDFKACEEADYEEHGDMILEDDERLAQQNLEHEDLAVWSTMGNSPELTTPYPHFVWPIVAVFGVWVRGDYMRLFIDGIAANVIIPFAVSEDLSQVETPEHIKTDTYMFFDRYKMRWVPEYGAEFIYMPSEVTANTYSYALTVMGAFHWFFFGFMIVVGVIGVGWLALRTFREVVNAYWTAAFFSVVYAIIIVFGDSFGFGLLDYAIPLAGVLESYGQYLDGWAAETGLTDAFYEFRYYALDHYYSFRRYRRYNYGKTRRKRRKIAHKFFLVVGTLYILYYPTMNAGQVEEPWLHANWFDRFLTWLKSDPARQESGRYRYPIVSPLHDAFTSGFLRARLWATKIRKRFGGGGPEE
jgi:hypothetical protein